MVHLLLLATVCVCVIGALARTFVFERQNFGCGCWSSPAYMKRQHLLSQPDKESIMEAIHLCGEGLQMK